MGHKHHKAINELQIIVDKNKLKKIRAGLLKKLNDIDLENSDELIKITNTINAIDNILNVDNETEATNKNIDLETIIPDKAINTKEGIQVLKGLTVGNEEYEDWQLIKKAFRVCIIEKLLK